jgi:hypothetical protein
MIFESELATVDGAGIRIEDIPIDEFVSLWFHIAHDDKPDKRLVLAFVGTCGADAGFISCSKSLFDLREELAVAFVYANETSCLTALIVNGFPQAYW